MEINWKKVLMGGLAGAMVYPIASFLVTILLKGAFPFDPFALPGTRGVSDPAMWLYVVYPFLVSILLAFVYQLIHAGLPGKGLQKGASFAGIMFLIATIPNAFLVYSTMVYPFNFYVHQLLDGLLTFAVLGIVLEYIWERVR